MAWKISRYYWCRALFRKPVDSVTLLVQITIQSHLYQYLCVLTSLWNLPVFHFSLVSSQHHNITSLLKARPQWLPSTLRIKAEVIQCSIWPGTTPALWPQAHCFSFGHSAPAMSSLMFTRLPLQGLWMTVSSAYFSLPWVTWFTPSLPTQQIFSSLLFFSP